MGGDAKEWHRHQRGRSLHVRKAGGGSVGVYIEGGIFLLGPSERKAWLPEGLMVKPCLGVFPATLILFYSGGVSSLENCAPSSSTHSTLKTRGMKARVPTTSPSVGAEPWLGGAPGAALHQEFWCSCQSPASTLSPGLRVHLLGFNFTCFPTLHQVTIKSCQKNILEFKITPSPTFMQTFFIISESMNAIKVCGKMFSLQLRLRFP